MSGRDVPEDAFYDGECAKHGAAVFVDLMGDEYCTVCLADAGDASQSSRGKWAKAHGYRKDNPARRFGA